MLGRRRPVRTRGILSEHRRVARCDLSSLRNEIVLEGKSETVVTELSPFADSLNENFPETQETLDSRPRALSRRGRLSKVESARPLPAARSRRGADASMGSFLKPLASSRSAPPTDGSSAMKDPSQSKRQQGAAGGKRLGAVGRQSLRGAPLSTPLSGVGSSSAPTRSRSRGRSFMEGATSPLSGAPSKSPVRSGPKKVRETEILFGNIDLDANDDDPFEH